MKYLFLFIIAVIPIVLWGYVIFNKKKGKDYRIFIYLFIGGILSCFLTLTISSVLQTIFPFLIMSEDKTNFLLLFVQVFIGIALVEEFSKWIFTYSIMNESSKLNYIYDIIVASVFVSLGFAFFENISYVFETGIGTGILRAFTAIPGHICDGIFMGYYIGISRLAKINGRNDLYKKNLILSLIVPFIMHGIYDYLIFLQTFATLILFYVYVTFLYIVAFKKIKSISSIKRKMEYKYNYCSNCGYMVESDYCPRCGRKNI